MIYRYKVHKVVSGRLDQLVEVVASTREEADAEMELYEDGEDSDVEEVEDLDQEYFSNTVDSYEFEDEVPESVN